MKKVKPRKRGKDGRLPPLADPKVLLAEAGIVTRRDRDLAMLRILEKRHPELKAELDRRDRAATRGKRKPTKT